MTLLQAANNLTVSDAERLAKAGVTIDLEKVYIREDLNPPLTTPEIMQSRMMESREKYMQNAFWQRWSRSIGGYMDGSQPPFYIAAAEYEDKVVVFVAPRDKEPFLFNDSKALYPSDALMAALALLEHTK